MGRQLVTRQCANQGKWINCPLDEQYKTIDTEIAINTQRLIYTHTYTEDGWAMYGAPIHTYTHIYSHSHQQKKAQSGSIVSVLLPFGVNQIRRYRNTRCSMKYWETSPSVATVRQNSSLSISVHTRLFSTDSAFGISVIPLFLWHRFPSTWHGTIFYYIYRTVQALTTCRRK